ncbi:MAG TPA: hypothetical protein VHR97_03330 [Candidatus Baltobacteraceae bacterium]|jgi:hypothetical protein|nr:hypothetical protein [Candidatus Baltobacteraceae bacterium]
MKNPPLRTAGDASTESLRAAGSFPFRIVSMRRVDYGSKQGEFTIETPIGLIEADLFKPEDCEPFAQTRSVRDKYSGQWRRTVTLDRAFAARILAALRGQAPNAEAKRGERKTQGMEPSATLLESERCFDAASAELDGGKGAA